jgi:hypothetical protein
MINLDRHLGVIFGAFQSGVMSCSEVQGLLAQAYFVWAVKSRHPIRDTLV